MIYMSTQSNSIILIQEFIMTMNLLVDDTSRHLLVDPSQSFIVDEKEPAFGIPTRYPNAIPRITLDHPHLVNPTGEFGLDIYIDCGAYSPYKFPTFKTTPEKKKKKEPKKKQEGVKRRKPI